MRGLNRVLVFAVAAGLMSLSFPALASGGWTIVPSPSRPGDLTGLGAVSAIFQTNAYAVGFSDGGYYQLQHWDGTRWRQVHRPEIDPFSDYFSLNGVAGLRRTDVWVVGEIARSGGSGPEPFTAHYDGKAWTDVPNPPLGNPGWLNAVAALGPDDVWAVGPWGGRQLVEHWNGGAWHRVRPSPAGAFSILDGVSRASAGDVWVVGAHATVNGPDSPLIEHWDGTVWTVLTPFSSNEIVGTLYAVSADGGSDARAPPLPGMDVPDLVASRGSPVSRADPRSGSAPRGRIQPVRRRQPGGQLLGQRVGTEAAPEGRNPGRAIQTPPEREVNQGSSFGPDRLGVGLVPALAPGRGVGSERRLPERLARPSLTQAG